jgi:hypothetical protein
MTETPQQAFDRGTVAGQIDARLAAHDRHFADINGSLAKLVIEVHDVVVGLTRVEDRMVADRATVVTTADALEKAEIARRTVASDTWSRAQKILAVWAALATAIGLWLAFNR